MVIGASGQNQISTLATAMSAFNRNRRCRPGHLLALNSESRPWATLTGHEPPDLSICTHLGLILTRLQLASSAIPSYSSCHQGAEHERSPCPGAVFRSEQLVDTFIRRRQ